MQVKVELPVGVAVGELVGGLDRQGALADPTHPVNRTDHHRPPRHAGGHGEQASELRELRGPSSEGLRQAGQLAGDRQRRRADRRRRQHRGQGWLGGQAGQVDPRAGAGLLGMHPNRLPPRRVKPLVAVPHHPLIDRIGDHQHHRSTTAVGKGGAGRLGVQQPKAVVEVLAGVPVGVVEDVAVVDRDPQPQPPRPAGLLVVSRELGGEGAEQRMQQGRGGHVGVEQDQDPVAKIAAGGKLRWWDLGCVEGVVEQGVQSGAELGAEGVGPARVAEPFDVEGEDPSPDRSAPHPPSYTRGTKTSIFAYPVIL
jgi:hypothetical protein